ncbi:hypothetical protein [Niallia sp. NCCP-28]|uniref:hypothetical protein n=1 Tax=Niallia sp. NCCP-28 TaxID=2934712 RepID=UPI002088893A|nr:hypothetical protein [Niallia sp. NCCP-28]GKU82916.1 hypothetical protein NCCP28_23120 [Niallia sp. NCCP-28]
MGKKVVCMLLLAIVYFNVHITANAAQTQTNNVENEILTKEIIQLQKEIKDLKKDSDQFLTGTDWVAIGAALVALLGSGLTFFGTKKSIKAAKESSDASNQTSERLAILEAETQSKQRLIEVVSTQRVQWINSLRENFSQLARVTYQMTNLRERNEDVPNELDIELNYYVNHIELFLNPTEELTKTFIVIKDTVGNYLMSHAPFDIRRYGAMMQDLHYLQQVILKSEWRRLKLESTTGTEVDDMEEIHKMIAKKINENNYNRLLRNAYEGNN